MGLRSWLSDTGTARPGPSFGLLIARLGFGGLILAAHGWSKLANFGAMSGQFADPIGLGTTTSLALTVFAQAFCGLALALGFLTRLAAIPLTIQMFVLIFIVHANDPWHNQEFALLFLLAWLTLLFTGAGRYSIDYVMFKNRRLPSVVV
jgi:putative oxidoreductase